MRYLTQALALAKKDLIIIVWRRWLSTAIRALILPVVFTVILAEIQQWTATSGTYGVGTAMPIHSFSDALARTGGTRPKVIIMDSGFKTGDIGQVVTRLSDTIRSSGKELHVMNDDSTLPSLCPSSNGGVSDCYGAVYFHSSPDHGGGSWNYTMYSDSSLGHNVDVTRNDADIQIYGFPFLHAINDAIASTHGGSGIQQNLLQYPYTYENEAQKEQQDREGFQDTVIYFLAWALYIGIAGMIYHAAGHICQQRENGLLQLIDAMMPKKSPWESIAVRIISVHLTFDLVYLPSWIIMGASFSTIAFLNTNQGYLIALYILSGLASMSYTILASSFFRKAGVSAIVAIVVALVLAIVAQYAEGTLEGSSTGGVLALAILFPPAAFVYFFQQIAGYELENARLNATVPSDVFDYYQVSAASLLGTFFFAMILYPVLGAVIEYRLHVTSPKSRTVTDSASMGGVAVRLTNFTKRFKSRTNKKETVTAVDDLTLDVHTGSITVLLGANGSGKSTTLNAIAGLESITQGTIEIDGTGGLGICPQGNIMYDLLTVRENIAFFEALKNTSSRSRAERKAEVGRLISGCDLDVKANALSKTLSGGQKRKLQLAMMLSGGSRVCCIDEASSGIDPIARRKVWDILLAERGKRTLLFTTHFLDEAEGLADRIAILSRGVLKAQDSVAGLKNSLGGSYQVLLPGNVSPAGIPVPEGVTLNADYNRASFTINETASLAKIIGILEQRGVTDYRIEGPTIEKVFLKLADEMQGDSDLARELRLADSSDGEREHGFAELSMAPGKTRALDLVQGRGVSPVRQTWILFRKRITVLKHNYMPYISVLIVSLVVAGAVTRFFKGDVIYPNGVPCNDPGFSPSASTFAFIPGPGDFYGQEFVWGPPSRLSAATLQAAIPNVSTHSYYYGYSPNVTSSPTVSTLKQFNDYVAANSSRLYDGAFFDDANAPVIAWMASPYNLLYDQLGLLSVADNVLMNQTLIPGFKTFAHSFTPSDDSNTLVAIFTTLGFAIYPGLFALYPTAERIRKVRAMHYSNGISSASIWIAHAMFDFLFVVLISVVTIIVWVTQWGGWYAPGYMFVCFFLYGLAGTAFSYIVSLFVTSQLAAFAFTSVIQVIISMLYLVGYITTASNAPPNEVYTWFNYIHYTIGLISPAANLERALFMTLNQYSLVCRGTQKASYPGEIGIYGAPILYLLVQFIVFSLFLMFWESGRSLEVFGIRTKRKSKTTQQDPEKVGALAQGPDAIEDPSRLSADNLGLRVANVSKTFGSNRAVDNVTFGILPSEKFALLGPNGAGKSTMISLIRRELQPDSSSKGGSSIYIGGDNLEQSPVAAKSHLGVCPQFDAVDSMTLIEHLRFYARARGVPDGGEGNISELIRRLGLEEHKNKLARKLSGGTRRKLSLAIALIGNPSVLLLDEPSSGMDPAAKRALWGTLSAISEGRVLVLTTHSMEEADALCDRAGILASRLLALGSVDDLHRRHGNAAFVHLVHKDAPYTSDADAVAMRDWVRAAYPTAVFEQRNFGGQMRFSVPHQDQSSSSSSSGRHASSSSSSEGEKTNVEAGESRGDVSIGRLFKQVEAVKEELGIANYSIGPATLDQVFLNVVGRHNVQEENTEKQKVKKVSLWKRIFR